MSLCFPGIISCNGADGAGNTGGASGGSIILRAPTFNGKGQIMANGGTGIANCWINCW